MGGNQSLTPPSVWDVEKTLGTFNCKGVSRLDRKKWKTANDDDASFPANDNSEELSLGPVDKRLPTTTDKLIVCANRLESELCGEGIDLRGQLKTLLSFGYVLMRVSKCQRVQVVALEAQVGAKSSTRKPTIVILIPLDRRDR